MRVKGNKKLLLTNVPSSASSSGDIGQVSTDGTYWYVCSSKNTWKRSELTTWADDLWWNNVALLLHLNGTGSIFTDSSSSPKTIIAYGNATQNADQSKWLGSRSLYLDGSSSLVTSSSSSLAIPGAFALEMWFYPLSNDSTLRSLVHLHTGSPNGLHVSYMNGNVKVDNGLAAGLTSSGVTLTTNTWHHIAVARIGGTGTTISIYIDGVRAGQYSSQDMGTTNTMIVGWFYAQEAVSRGYGYMSDIRLTIGTDRGWTGSTITVPTSSFSNA